ncbi:MAG: MGMT family protein [Clostridia bacterium]|nr:MGMT family protein [Clostridia bacterium]
MNSNEVYEYLLKIPKGKVVTYGMIARHFGNIRLSRVVGNILHKNPDFIKYPCYKVVNREGKLTPNYAFGGIEVQKEFLQKDGIEVVDYKVDLSKYLWK